jgi:ABC-type glycerol-3-phosphate transport system permease component
MSGIPLRGTRGTTGGSQSKPQAITYPDLVGITTTETDQYSSFDSASGIIRHFVNPQSPIRNPQSDMPQSQKTGRRVSRLLIYSILFVSCIFMLVPFAWMLSSSLMKESDMFQVPPVFVPNPPRIENYTETFNALPFATFFRNTIVLTVGRLLPLLFSCSLAAFGFARLRARRRNLLFMIMLSTMMLPGQVTMIPMYILFAKIGWVNTYLPMIVPSFFGIPFYIFMMRQFFMTIPTEYDESARLDGASTLQIFYKIILPLSKPALAAMSIFIFMWSWNDFFTPLIYLHDPQHYPLALGLQLFRTYGEYATRWDYIMAGSVMMAIPPLLLFFFSQRYFVEGVMVTGLKG